MADTCFVVDNGLAITTNRLIGAGAEPHHAGMGTGGVAATATDTALGTPVESRVEGTSSRVQTSTSNDTYQVVATIQATAARAVIEFGLFDDATAGSMFMRAAFDVINLSLNDSIQFTAKAVYAN